MTTPADPLHDYRHASGSVTKLHIHFVFVTKYRRKVITDRVRGHLIGSFRDTCDRYDTALIEADGEADHMHLLLACPPTHSVSTLARALKANSSRSIHAAAYPEVRKRLWGSAPFWSPSYFAASVGGAPLETVRSYIENQRAHGTS